MEEPVLSRVLPQEIAESELWTELYLRNLMLSELRESDRKSNLSRLGCPESPADLREALQEVARVGLPGRCGGHVDGLGRIFEKPVTASGVFFVVFFRVTNVSDSTIYISDADFRIVDENELSHGVAGEAIQSLVCALKYSVTRSDGSPMSDSEMERIPRPASTTRVTKYYRDLGSRNWGLVFQGEPVKPQATRYVQGIFDIPRTGFERKLAISFENEAPVPIPKGAAASANE